MAIRALITSYNELADAGAAGMTLRSVFSLVDSDTGTFSGAAVATISDSMNLAQAKAAIAAAVRAECALTFGVVVPLNAVIMPDFVKA